MSTPLRRALRLAGPALALSLVVPSLAVAAPPLDCTNSPAPRTIFSGQGRLESIIFGKGGRMYFTGTPTGEVGRLMKVDSPTAQPAVLSADFDGPGGMVWNDHSLIVGRGNTAANGPTGDDNPQAQLVRVDPGTGAQSIYAQGLGMANGVARAPDGTIYASNDFGSKLDRIAGTMSRHPKPGTVTHGWASVLDGNGMAVETGGRYLFVNQTFVTPSAIARVDLDDPTNVKTFASVPGEPNAILDGMTRDADNNLYVAALGAGQIWRVDIKGRICVLARGLVTPSSVAFGRGKQRFHGGDLYAITFSGDVVKLPRANKASYPG